MGYSGVTPIKQKHFREVLAAHLKITQHVIDRWRRNGHKHDHKYNYYDLTAGAGYDENDNPGSPIIFLQMIKNMDMPYNAVFLEENKKHAEELQNVVNQKAWVINSDYCNELMKCDDRLHKRKFGLLYVDPNGIFDVESIKYFTNIFTYATIDILINCNSTAIKRVRISSRHQEKRTLYERMVEIKKTKWLVRKPEGKHQWTFLLGTNMRKFPEFKKINFVDLNSDEGQDIFNYINLTKSEREYSNYGEYLKHPRFLEVKKKHGLEPGACASDAEKNHQLTLTI